MADQVVMYSERLANALRKADAIKDVDLSEDDDVMMKFEGESDLTDNTNDISTNRGLGGSPLYVLGRDVNGSIGWVAVGKFECPEEEPT